jgi:hypothetical protein
MGNSKLPIYKGRADSCLCCEHEFENEEVINVEGEEELFCPINNERGCIAVYVFLTGTPGRRRKLMRFRK